MQKIEYKLAFMHEKFLLTVCSLAWSSYMPSTVCFAGSSPSAKTCSHKKKSHVVRTQAELWMTNAWGKHKTSQTWLIVGWAFVFFFEVVSRPQREENLLLRLLQERDMACVRRLTPVSVRAATCKKKTTTTVQSVLKHTKWDGPRSIWIEFRNAWKRFNVLSISTPSEPKEKKKTKVKQEQESEKKTISLNYRIMGKIFMN